MNEPKSEIQEIAASPFDTGEGFELAQREARAFAASSIVPEDYQNNIANCLIAMEISSRIGASTLAVMQHLYIVYGKPAFDATFLISTVNASSRFTPIRYKFSGEEGSDQWSCRAYAMDKESGEDCIGPAVSIAMAKDEGWFNKKGSKWKTLPELMLHYRAAAFWTRVYAPELSMGIHTKDEITDTVDIGPSKVTTPSEALEQFAEKIKAQEIPKTEIAEKAKDPRDHLIDIAKSKWGDSWKDKLDIACAEESIEYKKITEEQTTMMIEYLTQQTKE